jgi:prepilin-type N-terminal cleavage/methylation domain-containing protein/prepilin-type processing-associated H-X9-DG protein
MMKPVSTPARRSTGFTLIELLVVISIIALLVSILLPALGKARQATVTISCANQQRQTLQGFYQYAADFKGHFPGLGDAGNSSGAGTSGIWASWAGRLWATGNLPKRGPTKYNADPVIGSTAIFTGILGCPATTVASGFGSVVGLTTNFLAPWEIAGTTYGLNWQMWRTSYPTKVLNVSANHNIPVNPDRVPRASSVLLMADQAYKDSAGGSMRCWRQAPRVSDASPSNYWENVDFRHGITMRIGNSAGTQQVVNYRGVSNVGFFDGHVQALDETTVSITTSSRIWTGGL